MSLQFYLDPHQSSLNPKRIHQYLTLGVLKGLQSEAYSWTVLQDPSIQKSLSKKDEEIHLSALKDAFDKMRLIAEEYQASEQDGHYYKSDSSPHLTEKWFIEDVAKAIRENKTNLPAEFLAWAPTFLNNCLELGICDIATALLNVGVELPPDVEKEEAISYAAKFGNVSLLTALLTKWENNIDLIRQAAAVAVVTMQPDTLTFLLAKKDPNVSIGKFLGLIETTSLLGYLIDNHAKEPKLKQIISVLLKAGMDVNEQDADKDTPLHRAMVNEHAWPIIPLLVTHGASQELRNNRNQCAADMAYQKEPLIILKKAIRMLPVIDANKKLDALTEDMAQMKRALVELTDLVGLLVKKVMSQQNAPSSPPLSFRSKEKKVDNDDKLTKRRSLSPS